MTDQSRDESRESSARRRLPAQTVIECVGLLLFAIGLWRMSPNWCLVIVGGLIVAFSVFGTLRRDRARHRAAEMDHRKG